MTHTESANPCIFAHITVFPVRRVKSFLLTQILQVYRFTIEGSCGRHFRLNKMDFDLHVENSSKARKLNAMTCRIKLTDSLVDFSKAGQIYF